MSPYEIMSYSSPSNGEGPRTRQPAFLFRVIHPDLPFWRDRSCPNSWPV